MVPARKKSSTRSEISLSDDIVRAMCQRIDGRNLILPNLLMGKKEFFFSTFENF